MAVADVIGGLFLITGSLFTMLAGVGVVRFPDIYSRMHAAAKAPVLGIMFVGIGVVVMVGTVEVATVVGLVVVLQLIAAPVGSHLIARSVYVQLNPELDDVDELADIERDSPPPANA